MIWQEHSFFSMVQIQIITGFFIATYYQLLITNINFITTFNNCMFHLKSIGLYSKLTHIGNLIQQISWSWMSMQHKCGARVACSFSSVKIELQDRFFHDRDFFQTWDERLRCNFGLDAHHNANLAWQEVISKCLKRGCAPQA